MNPLTRLIGSLTLGLATSGAVLAQTVVDLPPNLKAWPAGNISLVSSSDGTTTLRFATTSWNSGTGPLELVAGAVDTGSGRQKVSQRIYLSDGSAFLHDAGWFEYHPGHDHIHFDDYALYTLQPVNAPGGSQRIGAKTTFCVMDNTKVNSALPGAPASAVYSSCGRFVQGMSVGWGDTYGAHLSGQEIDFTDNADGIYQLKIDIDPKANIVESDKSDNASCVLLDIKKPSMVTVLDFSGSCSTVTSITPNSASLGTTVQVTLTGYGFAAGMPISFEGGQGVRPVASNVQLVTDTESLDTITATVTVPKKKNPGRNPVWDVRVGSGGVLPKAFTVTR
ncbi:lysyl oxidase family protein [uncultured Piscinibacter sp.]|uniref:lysyl oxidase family protein n=1 Tax=uncultured Piscinibacter sp. TaxID=1131835 RepID=UPI00261F84C9|nr:lysyl oxidase family protein [uncultured Piscinibacter sp.]